jgi:hypothetical protein
MAVSLSILELRPSKFETESEEEEEKKLENGCNSNIKKPTSEKGLCM